MEDNIFQYSNEDIDVSTKKILDKYYKVIPRNNYPKLVPYVDNEGKSVSPLTDFMYYHKLPEVYRVFDEPLGRPLYRYLQSLIDSGYADLVYSSTVGKGGISNLLELINPETCPDKFLPIYCKSVGIEWFQDLVISNTEYGDPYHYIRTFLCNFGEIYKRRGTESVVKYIAKTLTSMDVKVKYNRVFEKDSALTRERILWVELQANTQEEIASVRINSEIIKRFIDTQLPYYITAHVIYAIKSSQIDIQKYYSGFAHTKVRTSTLLPRVYMPTNENDYIYEIVGDVSNIIMYIGSDTDIIVPETLEGKPVKTIYTTAFNYSNVRKIIIPEGIYEIA